MSHPWRPCNETRKPAVPFNGKKRKFVQQKWLKRSSYISCGVLSSFSSRTSSSSTLVSRRGRINTKRVSSKPPKSPVLHPMLGAPVTRRALTVHIIDQLFKDAG